MITSHVIMLSSSRNRLTNYRIRRLRLSRLLLVQEARHPSPRIIRTLARNEGYLQFVASRSAFATSLEICEQRWSWRNTSRPCEDAARQVAQWMYRWWGNRAFLSKESVGNYQIGRA